MTKKYTLKVERYDDGETGLHGSGVDQPSERSGGMPKGRWLEILGAPVIYGMFLPAALMDLCVTVYQLICFPIYGIDKVDRGQFFGFDRHKLHYLNGLEKFNCAFCSYFNSVVSYTQEVASLTEERFCPIKHKLRPSRHHKRYDSFSEYADPEGFRARQRARRRSKPKREQ